MKKNKFKLLRNGILLDLVGMATTFIPLGVFLDLIWAPYAAKRMSDMYEGNTGKIASWIVFIEEILPFSDFVPTFTLMWIYTFVIASEKQTEVQTIEVEITE
ncbi:MAG: hypothetical protein HKO54_07550 [Flavobacteriaceae bacterium]|nr:hypothetical protein [Flavobacteriaceae bacterium]